MNRVFILQRCVSHVYDRVRECEHVFGSLSSLNAYVYAQWERCKEENSTTTSFNPEMMKWRYKKEELDVNIEYTWKEVDFIP